MNFLDELYLVELLNGQDDTFAISWLVGWAENLRTLVTSDFNYVTEKVKAEYGNIPALLSSEL